MKRTVLGFIEGRLLPEIESEYITRVNPLVAWFHKKDPTCVCLSPDLFARLVSEEGINPEGGKVDLRGLVIMAKPSLKRGIDLEINMKSHYSIGYNSRLYGLS